MLKKAGVAVLALLALLAVVIAFQPASYRVERSTTIAPRRRRYSRNQRFS